MLVPVPSLFLMTVWIQENLFHQTTEKSDYLKSSEVCILLCCHFPSSIRGRNIKNVICFMRYFFVFLSFSLLVYEKMRRQSANKPFTLASHYAVGCSVGFFLHRNTYLHTCMYLFHRNIQSSFLLQQFQLSVHVLSCKVLSLVIPQPLRCGLLWGEGCKSMMANKKSLKL